MSKKQSDEGIGIEGIIAVAILGCLISLLAPFIRLLAPYIRYLAAFIVLVICILVIIFAIQQYTGGEPPLGPGLPPVKPTATAAVPNDDETSPIKNLTPTISKVTIEPQVCGDLTRGERGVVSGTIGGGKEGLLCRDTPSLSGEITDGLTEGTELIVIDGPFRQDPYVWWHLQKVCWAADDWLDPLDTPTSVPVPVPVPVPTPAPTPMTTEPTTAAPGGGLKIRGRAIVTGTMGGGKSGLLCNKDHSVKAKTIAWLAEGSEVTVIDGPVSQDGHGWWQLGLAPCWAPGNWVCSLPGDSHRQPMTLQIFDCDGGFRQYQSIAPHELPGFATLNLQPGLPPLRAVTAASSKFDVRRVPHVKIPENSIGTLQLREMPVSILAVDGERDEGELWFQVQFHDADFEAIVDGQAEIEVLKDAYGRSVGWVRSDATFLRVTIPWHLFLDQLKEFEDKHLDMSVRDRITLLRQMSHPQKLPFDEVIGTGSGSGNRVYWDQRHIDTSRWQILLEAQGVEMPNGEIVDMQHVLVGLDVLPEDRRKEEHSFRFLGIIDVYVGQNYSAATWAGDCGAAAADYIAHKADIWEQNNSTCTDKEKLEFYFRTRAPDADPLGDIDACGIDSLIMNRSDNILTTNEGVPIESVGYLLTLYYGPGQQSAEEYKVRIHANRRQALETFLRHYDFVRSTDLTEQESAADFKMQIHTFGKVWDRRDDDPVERMQINWKPDEGLEQASSQIGTMFLDWLEAQAQYYEVNLEE